MSQPANAPAPLVSTAELHQAIEGLLSRHFAAPRRIIRLGRRRSDYCTSFTIEELDVCLDDGTILQLMFKDLSQQALLECARQAKPVFCYDPRREIETYRGILAHHHLGTATCYGAIVNHQVGRYWLLLERVPGLELYQVGDFAIWQQVARWLARMHTRFSQRPRLRKQAMMAHLLRYDVEFYWQWMHRALRFWHQAESRSGWRKIEWLSKRYRRVIEYLIALPVTLIHGEFYASNILVQETAGKLRVCPIDWEMAAVGPGLIDLAALTAGRWSEEEKAALAQAYYTALPPVRRWPRDLDAHLTALDYCQLHLAVQWLGWSVEWSPPPDHAQDWLSEAMRLAEKLNL